MSSDYANGYKGLCWHCSATLALREQCLLEDASVMLRLYLHQVVTSLIWYNNS